MNFIDCFECMKHTSSDFMTADRIHSASNLKHNMA